MPSTYVALASFHSLWRWLVLALALIGLIKAVLSLVRRAAPDRIDFDLHQAYSIALSLQALVGIILVIWVIVLSGILFNLVHGLVMIVAVGVTQMFGARARRLQNQPAASQQTLTLAYLLSLLIIGIGIQFAASLAG